MTHHEFDHQLSRLQKKFGDRSYDEETTKIFWKALRGLSDGVLKDAVDLAIAELRPNQAPMLPELMTFVQRAGDRRPRSSLARKPCLECGEEGSGYLIYQNESRAIMAAACPACDVGRELGQVKGNGRKALNSVSDVLRAGFDKQVHPKKVQSNKRTPWPANVEGMLMNLVRGHGISLALKALKIDIDEAQYLLDVAKTKRWDDEWAKQILAKVPSIQSSISNLTNAVTHGTGRGR